MTLPHQFPSLIDGPAQVVIIAGTGLSAPNAPTVSDLEEGLTKIAQALSISPNGDFYELAETVLNNLVSSGKSDPESRLWLAEKLGMLDDRRWFGDFGLPLSGNTPRHRAIARFAVERRLRAIVSLNWDTLLEAALDSVGLAEDSRSPRPWQVTAHTRVIDDSHMGRLANANVFPVIKPHGCVRNIEEARRMFRSKGVIPYGIIFKLKKSELNIFPNEQRQVDKRVDVDVSECPLLAVGWKASEGYLRNTVITAVNRVKPIGPDAFTLVNRSWYPSERKTGTYHDEIAVAYGRTKAEVFVAVNNPGQPTLDCIFQWLQARYALTKLIASVAPPQQADLQRMLNQIDQPDCDHQHHPLLSWADRWLPSWLRLCWRAGVMCGTDPHIGRMIKPWEIPVIPRDVHVPLGTMTCERRELQAAAKLLITLGDTLRRFKFDMFPGGLWDEEKQCLYLPLPSWGEIALHSDLAALKPQIEAMRRWGFVREIRLVSLNAESASPDPSLCHQLEAHIRNLMPLTKFASGDALSWASLEELKGVSDATMA